MNCLLFHNWEPWVITEEGMVENEWPNALGTEKHSVVVGRFIYQKRVCKGCGFTEINKSVAKFE